MAQAKGEELMTGWENIRDAYKPDIEIRPCFCVGPQNGDPVCPCQMRSVKIRDGRYVIERDLGPVRSDPDAK